MNFFGASLRDAADATPRAQLIYDKVGHKLPVIGVGGVSTPQQADMVLSTGVQLVALGRELLIEPRWLEKLKNGQLDSIETALDVHNQSGLHIPTPMWNSLLTRTGWLPLKE